MRHWPRQALSDAAIIRTDGSPAATLWNRAPMDDPAVIVVGETPPELCPTPALERIWSRAVAVLRHYAWFNQDEARVRELQYGILNNGAFLVPSLFREGGDLCKTSFYCDGWIFYHFPDGEEEYFWITTQLDRCYALGALYFPAKRVAVALYPYTITSDLLRRFEATRRNLGRPALLQSAPATSPMVATGHFHMMHHLWNELPALDRAVGAGLASKLRVISSYQPMGALEEIFPELLGRVEAKQLAEITAMQRDPEMFVALGSWSITPATQARVIRVAHREAPRRAAMQQARFRAAHWPVFWFSVKPPPRTFTDQAETLLAMIEAVRTRHPRAGFLLDGVSHPWDYQANGNYPDWFRSMLDTASRETTAIMDEFLDLLPQSLRACVRLVTDVPVLEEVTWAAIADFYVCHGGSMQNKMGWLHPTPGVVHSNTSFMASARGMIPPVERAGAPARYIPDDFVVDDDPANYTPLQLSRKDQNYRFRSNMDLVAFVLTMFEQDVVQLKPAHRFADGPVSALDQQQFPGSVAPVLDDAGRIALAVRPRDCDRIPKVADAGEVMTQDGVRLQVMHNGLRMLVDAQGGPWVTRVIELCAGHYDVQRDRVVHEVLRVMPVGATMVELDGAGAYESLWFLLGFPGRRAIVVTPGATGTARANAALNGLMPEFLTGPVGRIDEARLTVEQIMQEAGLREVDLLCCGRQGQELATLESCLGLFAARRVRWVMVSTHAEMQSGDPLTHQRCLALLQDAGATIEAEYEVHESFVGDGLIAARFGPAPAGWSPVAISYSRYSESVFRNPIYDLAESRRLHRDPDLPPIQSL